ncbi:MAG: hypothetical protein ACYCSO_04255 [Cuniculiplasma sp.]
MAIDSFLNSNVTVVYDGNMTRTVCTLIGYDEMGITVVYRENKTFIPWRYIEEIREVTEQDRIEESNKVKQELKKKASPLIVFSITTLFIGGLVTYLAYTFLSQIPKFGYQRGITAAIASPIIIVGILGTFLAIFAGKTRIATFLSLISVIAVVVILIFFGS